MLPAVREIATRFQYHTGPIKRAPRGGAPAPCHRRFNTTLVQLKGEQQQDAAAQAGGSGFNTTLVQLKVAPCVLWLDEIEKFQYHTGPIKRQPI